MNSSIHEALFSVNLYFVLEFPLCICKFEDFSLQFGYL